MLGCFQPAVQVAVVMSWKLLKVSRSRAPWQPRSSSPWQASAGAPCRVWISAEIRHCVPFLLFLHLQGRKLQSEVDEWCKGGSLPECYYFSAVSPVVFWNHRMWDTSSSTEIIYRQCKRTTVLQAVLLDGHLLRQLGQRLVDGVAAPQRLRKTSLEPLHLLQGALRKGRPKDNKTMSFSSRNPTEITIRAAFVLVSE